MSNKRHWPISFILGIIPGLGQMYNGQIGKSIFFTFTSIGLGILGFSFVLIYYKIQLLNFLVLFIFVIFPRIFIIIEAAITSKKLHNNFKLKKYNRFYFYILYSVIIIFFISYPLNKFIRNILISSHKVPTGAMEDSILPGDCLLADILNLKKTLKLKRNDIIIFKYPGNDIKEYIKRIIALPGEKIKIDKTKILVNGKNIIQPLKIKYIRGGREPYIGSFEELEIPAAGDIIKLESLSIRNFLFIKHLIRQENPNAIVNSEYLIVSNGKIKKSVTLDQYDLWPILERNIEDLINDFRSEFDSSKVEVKKLLYLNNIMLNEYTVKNDNYFLLGDNRDNSSDSRYWGFVNTNNIKSKAKVIYFSTNKKVPIWNFISSIRWNRIGKPIE